MTIISPKALVQAYDKFEYVVMYDLLFLIGESHYWIHVQSQGQTLFKREVTPEMIRQKIKHRGVFIKLEPGDPRSLQEAIHQDIPEAAYNQFVMIGLLNFDVHIYDSKGTILDFGINVPSPKDIICST